MAAPAEANGEGVAERVGFEPTLPFWGKHALQACPINHSGTSPRSFVAVALLAHWSGGVKPSLLVMRTLHGAAFRVLLDAMSGLRSKANTVLCAGMVVLCAAALSSARMVPDSDHTVWVTIDSMPVGADVYTLAADGVEPVRLGSTPCPIPVDIKWRTKWFVKRWELISLESPGGIFRCTMRSDGAYDIRLKARLSKPGYINEEMDVTALTLNHPGKDWTAKVLWPREARVHAELRPVRARVEQRSEPAGAEFRKVWVAAAEASGDAGSVVIRANVEGSEVWVDGRRVAVAPVELVLQEGRHILEVRKAGYSTARREVVVVADEAFVYEALLNREP